jgi:hypothetical protein
MQITTSNDLDFNGRVSPSPFIVNGILSLHTLAAAKLYSRANVFPVPKISCASFV